MKHRLLDLLACPECAGAPLALEVFAREGDEIVHGVLSCAGCTRTYPVIAGVPRLLPDSLIGMLRRYHPEYFSRYSVTLSGSAVETGAVGRTLTFYSYARQKLFAREPSPELVAYWRHSLRKRIPEMDSFSGGLGLDAGCGEGRYTYCLAEIGAEVVGMDLSEAVNLAYLRNRAVTRAHIVQASIYQPPIRRGVLDFVMSTGVLHHLPDPEGGFAALVPLLRPRGSVHVWVYGLQRMSTTYQASHLVPLRRIGSRLSPQASYLLSVPIGLALYLLVFLPVRLLVRSGQTRITVNPQIRELSGLPLRMHIAEVQDRIGVPVTNFLTDEELRGWYARAGLRDVCVQASEAGRGWSARGSVPDRPLSDPGA